MKTLNKIGKILVYIGLGSYFFFGSILLILSGFIGNNVDFLYDIILPFPFSILVIGGILLLIGN